MALYPPIIEYSMPAFLYNQNSVRIYFGMSDFNSKADIRNVHMTVKYQDNNENALNINSYPASIKVCGYSEVLPQEDPSIAATPYRYYVELFGSDLRDGSFRQGITYKIQLRFSSDTSVSNNIGLGMDYFAGHLTQFSEWSTVCLIRGIVKPRLSLVGFDSVETANDETATVTLASVDASFIAQYVAGEKEETLKNWRMRLYAHPYNSLAAPLADSGIHLYNNYDFVPIEQNGSVSIDCSLPYEMESGKSYVLKLDIETKNGYKDSLIQTFTSISYASTVFPGEISLSINEQEGFALVKIEGNNNIIHNNVTIRRTSSKSNFKIWEDIGNKTFIDNETKYEFKDFTIESGVYYQYGAQTRDNRGRRGIIKVTTQEIGEFEDAFLTENGKQLKMRYDFQISQSALSIAESKTDTIGSKYPFVRRNGNMYYRTFQGSGLITAFMDEEHLFSSEAGLYYGYDQILEKHKAIRDTVDLHVHSYDYTKERNFRQLVEEFLCNGKIKLFKSLQEGNILVKVMNVSLTPKQELGRLLYSFTATFVEIDEVTLENLDKYGIQKIGTYNPNIVFGETKLGQLNSYISPFSANENIIEKIKTKYHFGKVVDKIKIDDLYLSYFKIEIESEPYLIKRNGAELYPIDDIYDADGVENIANANDFILGWLFNINGNTILIEPPNNIYELKGDNIYITSGWNISPLRDTKMTIDYVVNLSESNDISTIPTTLIYKMLNTQVVKYFKPNDAGDDIANILWYRYYTKYPTYYKKVNAFFTAEVDAEPGTIVYSKSDVMDKSTRFVIGETGLLFIDPGKTSIITSLTFGGINIDTRYLIPNYGKDNGKELFDKKHKKTQKPKSPIKYDYYEDAAGLHMFYNNKWCNAVTKDEGITYDIETGVDAIVNCYLQTVKGFY